MNTPADDVRLAHQFLHPTGPVEIRPYDMAGNRLSGFYRDSARLIDDVSDFAGGGVHWTVNQIDDSVPITNRYDSARIGACTSDKHIVRIRTLPLDFDPVRPKGVSATDGERAAAKAVADAAIQYCREHGFPEPLIVDSGSGVQAYFACDLPVADNQLVKAFVFHIRDKFSIPEVTVDDSVWTLSQLMRERTGNWNRKGPNTPDRPHRQSTIISCPATRETLTRETLVAMLPTAHLPTAQPQEDWYDSLSSTSHTPQQIYLAAAALHPKRFDDCHDWLRIGSALHDAGDGTEKYLPLWDDLSKSSAKYKPGETKNRWKSFGRDDGAKVATLFYLARQDGWQPPTTSNAADADDTFKVISSWELATGDYDVEWLIPEVLVARQPLVAGGASKAMKTSVLLDLAISLASKSPFLGHFPVNQHCRTLVMSGESGIQTLQETAIRIGWRHTLEACDLDALKWSEDLPQANDPSSLAKLTRTLERHRIEFLIIDPFYLCIGEGDPSNVFAQGQLLRNKLVMQEHGAQLAIAHHSVKGAAKQGKRWRSKTLQCRASANSHGNGFCSTDARNSFPTSHTNYG